MYEFLRGLVVECAENACVLEVAGVGYALRISARTGRALEPGEPALVHVHQSISDDKITLFGFSGPEERRLFRTLLKVKGVGPAGALSILSGVEPDSFLEALAGGDVAALTRIRGIGRKTAERILLELRDRLPELEGGALTGRGSGAGDDLSESAVRALMALGMDRSRARTAVEQAREGFSEPPALAVLVQAALRARFEATS